MKLLSFLLCIIISTTAFAQETKVVNDANAKQRNLNASFTAISVSDGIELFLTQGSEESVAVSYSDEKYGERFKTIVEDNVLKIYYDSKGISWSDNNRRQLKAYVSFKTIEKLMASGGADIKLQASAIVNNLSMKLTSGAGFNGNIIAKEMSVDQNSGSEINLRGKAEKITIDVSSGASFKGYEFAVNNCDAKASSGAGIKISVEKELSAKANSGGGIHYKGTALISNIDISSGGIVKKV